MSLDDYTCKDDEAITKLSLYLKKITNQYIDYRKIDLSIGFLNILPISLNDKSKIIYGGKECYINFYYLYSNDYNYIIYKEDLSTLDEDDSHYICFSNMELSDIKEFLTERLYVIPKENWKMVEYYFTMRIDNIDILKKFYRNFPEYSNKQEAFYTSDRLTF